MDKVTYKWWVTHSSDLEDDRNAWKDIAFALFNTMNRHYTNDYDDWNTALKMFRRKVNE